MMRRSLRTLVCLAAGLVVLGCDGRSPTVPTETGLIIRYVWTGDIAPATDPACPHHNAPADTLLTASWGLSQRMGRLSDGSWLLQTPPVSPGEHHLQLVDIRHCGVDDTPWVTAGFTVNGVSLNRTILVGGIPNVLFRLEAGGRVTP